MPDRDQEDNDRKLAAEAAEAAHHEAESNGDGDTTQPGDKEPETLGQEAPEIVDDASKIGAKRLHRPLLGDAITSFAGGMSISFGAIAFASAAAAVGGGLGTSSVALLVGKTELFTENFLLPVAAVVKDRGNLRQLGGLWGVTLAGNLLGALLFAFLVSRRDVLNAETAAEMIALAEHKIDYDFWTAFIKAIFAGWLMTTLTWLLVAAKGGLGPRIAVIWAMASLIVLGEFNHVIISAAEIFMAMLLGADISVGDWAMANFLPALLGNLLGGLVFETLLQTVQARYSEPDAQDA